MRNKLLQDLKFALSMKRPHGGIGVTKLCDYIINRVDSDNCYIDYVGNIHVDNRSLDSLTTTLFTAHVDTVHKTDGENFFVIQNGFINAKGDVLGADDGAGVAILLHLIDNNIPGYYIFFQGEEKGGIGSSWLANNRESLLREFDRAIAFDRKATFSIITHQMCGRTASDSFANALANELNNLDDSFIYYPDEEGIYTDTAEFEHIIPECTNVSVGYYNEHTHSEKLDLNHFKKLAHAVVQVKWEKLPTRRDPLVDNGYSTRSNKSYNRYFDIKYEDPVGGNDDNYYYYDRELEYKEDLIMALEDAILGLKGELKLILAEWALPGDEELASRFINLNKISQDDLNESITMLKSGTSVDEVINFLLELSYEGVV